MDTLRYVNHPSRYDNSVASALLVFFINESARLPSRSASGRVGQRGRSRGSCDVGVVSRRPRRSRPVAPVPLRLCGLERQAVESEGSPLPSPRSHHHTALTIIIVCVLLSETRY